MSTRDRDRNGLSRTALTGLKDLPSNTAWLFTRALKPVAHSATSATAQLSEGTDAASSAAGTLGETARRTTGKVINSLSGRDTPAQFMQEADAAGERAREAEARAVEFAERAERDAETATQVTAESRAEYQEARRSTEEQLRSRVEREEQEAAAAVDEVIREQQERVERARSGAEHHVDNVRLKEEAAARKRLEQIEAEANHRAQEAQRRAQESQARATAAVEQASAAIEQAQELANQAAAAAREAAAAASEEAERLAREAKHRASEAQKKAAAAERVRDRNGSQLRSSRPAKERSIAESDTLLALPKPDLVSVAQALDVEGATQMSKGELASALAEAEVPYEVLSKRDLLRLGESKGLDVRQSMSKQELIESIA